MGAHMRTESADALLLLLPLLLMVGLSLSGCATDKPPAPDLKRDHEAISRILDAAVLHATPWSEFTKALPAVRAYSSVDSAWTDGITFFVRYKNGGIVSWTAPPQPSTQDKR
jgi:hypothetical protein